MKTKLKKQPTKKANQRTNETIINGSRVFVEDGEVKTIFNEDIQRTGFMTIEEAYELLCAAIDKVYEIDEDE